MSDKILNVHQRLAAAMEKVDYIQKEQKKGMNYSIVSHDAVTAKVRPILLSQGIVYYPVRCDHLQDGNRAECSMTIRFVNIDEPTDYFDVPTFGYGIDPQDKGPGKAMSYAVKYALLKALGLETGDDPDNDAIPHDPAPKQKAISSAQNKRHMETIERELIDCRTPNDVTKLLNSWADQGEKEGWSNDYWSEAKTKFARRRRELAEDTVGSIEETFGSANTVDDRIRDKSGREVHNLEGA
ncbi:hypothetical protein EON76_05220 [bacterium]|nr:MAG: hypothetical protein EON76_05220 [bacterium]